VEVRRSEAVVGLVIGLMVKAEPGRAIMPSTVSWRLEGCVHCGMRQMSELHEGGGRAQRMRKADECPLHWSMFSQPDCHDCNCQGSRQA
jgi:hypothetical protein